MATKIILLVSSLLLAVSFNSAFAADEWCAECEASAPVLQKIYTDFQKLGGNKIALDQALCFLDKNKHTNFEAKGDSDRAAGIAINNQRFLTINDLVQSSKQARLFIIDLKTGEVQVTFSAHGGGQKKLGDRIASLETAKEFSNTPDSNLSPRGFFITGSRYESGKTKWIFGLKKNPEWKFGMRLHGLQLGINDNTFERAIVMHPYPEMEKKLFSVADIIESPEKLSAKQMMPLSWGCTMLSEIHASDIVDKIKASSSEVGGSLYYNFTVTENKYGEDYCGDEALMIKH